MTGLPIKQHMSDQPGVHALWLEHFLQSQLLGAQAPLCPKTSKQTVSLSQECQNLLDSL